MRVVIQRVSNASVIIADKLTAEINAGYLILLGIESNDSEEDVDWLVRKISSLRVFADENGKMNKDINDIDGNVLVVSQFTLHAKYKKGTRPSFIHAARPEQAIPLYESFKSKIGAEIGKQIQSGEFGADMKVNLINDGPVTITMDTKNKE